MARRWKGNLIQFYSILFPIKCKVSDRFQNSDKKLLFIDGGIEMGVEKTSLKFNINNVEYFDYRSATTFRGAPVPELFFKPRIEYLLGYKGQFKPRLESSGNLSGSHYI